MHNLTLGGTPAQMGQQHGSMMAGRVQLPPLAPAQVALADACEAAAIDHTPALVDEMRAFAEAARVPYGQFKAFMLTAPLAQTLPTCSAVAVLPARSADGCLMVGRNYDFTYFPSQQGATTYSTAPAQGYAHVGNSDIWIGREDGLNEAGLFVAMSATFLPGARAGLPFWFIVRHLLEQCASVDGAVAWIEAIPHAQSRNYMLADATQALVIEASIDGVAVREPEDGLLVMTNHPALPDLRPRAAFVPDDSPVRYDRLRALPEDGVTLDDLQAALNDREHFVCAHGEVYGQPFGTIWSMMARPAESYLAIAPGTGDNSGVMAYRRVPCSKSAHFHN